MLTSDDMFILTSFREVSEPEKAICQESKRFKLSTIFYENVGILFLYLLIRFLFIYYFVFICCFFLFIFV